MRIIKTSEHLPTDTLGQLAFYNGLDVLSLFEIHSAILSSMSPTHRATYAFEMELQAPLLEMEFNGLLIDPQERANMVKRCEAEKIKWEAHLHTFCEAVGYYNYYLELAANRYTEATDFFPTIRSWPEWLTLPLAARREWKARDPDALAAFQKALKEVGQPFNASSVAQKTRLFYHFLGSPSNEICQTYGPTIWSKSRGITEVRGRKSNGEYGPSTDREALEKIISRGSDDPRDAAYWARPFAYLCLAIADLTKTLGMLNSRLENGYFKSTFSCTTETGRLASRTNSQGFGSNSQNVSPKLRSIFTCPLGEKMVAIDYSQIESRCVAARCFTLFGSTAYLRAVDSGDCHSLTASMVWPNLAWPADFTIGQLSKHGPFLPDIIKAAKKVASEPFYRGKSRRDVVKTLSHGSNYQGKPQHMARQSHIEQPLVEHFQDMYFAAFPEIRQWHRWVIEQVEVYQKITTLMGRTRQFFSRSTDDSTIREAVAFDPQSMAADYTNSALIQIHKAILEGALQATLRLQKHDEIVVTCREQDVQEVVSKMVELMEHKLILTSPSGEQRIWFVPADVEVGWNLGRRSETNPDGLASWPDQRARQRDPFDMMRIVL
jgi:hypothetical protein